MIVRNPTENMPPKNVLYVFLLDKLSWMDWPNKSAFLQIDLNLFIIIF